MAYNKAKEERKWRLWKEAEEKKLRSLGVSEDAIEQLHAPDLKCFLVFGCYIGRTLLPKSKWEVKHYGKNY